MVALSVPMLGEEGRLAALDGGGGGLRRVIVMLDPLGISFHTISLVVLGATFCYSLSTVLVRARQPP
jgi:hypothetical protein